MKNILEKSKKIHFIGIGGVGISAIAKMMHIDGKKITGSDQSISPITNKLKKSGIRIFIGHKKENISKNTDLVIYTIAIPENNPELFYARNIGIHCITYPEALGIISKDKYTIAISGTHGKTTTTAMIAHIAIKNNLKPTVIVGSFINGQDNFVAGEGKYFIVEACEYKRSFLNLSPFILVITNIEEDHLDYYKNIGDIIDAFSTLSEKIPSDGAIVCDSNNANVKKAIAFSSANIIDYTNIMLTEKLSVPGKHNIENAKASVGVAQFLGISKESAVKHIKTFKGTWRRQEYIGKTKKKAIVYDDYAHHPTEIRALISTLRELYKDKKINIIFQPHLYSRTKIFLKDFAKELSLADKIIITDIYAAREKKDKTISGKMLSDKIFKLNNNVIYLKTFNEIVEKVEEYTNNDDVIVTVGAGNIYEVAKKLVI